MNTKKFVDDREIRAQFERDLAELIAVKSVASAADGKYPYGKGSAAALDTMLAIGEKYGFRTENHDYHCGSVIFGDSSKEVGIIAHLDVVPAGEGWSTADPYKIEKRGECWIGRGVRDDKGPAMMGLYAMRCLKESGVKLPFSVRLFLGCDEEVGSTDLEYFKTVRKAPWFSFTPDSEFPVCIGEKGIMSFTLSLGRADASIVSLCGGSVSNAVPREASVTLRTDKQPAPDKHIKTEMTSDGLRITATGVTAHASTPETGLNAVWLLADYMMKNNLVPAANEAAFGFLRDSEGEYLGRTFGMDFSDEYFGYLTCVGGVLSLHDGEIYINYNVRFPMSKTYDTIFASVENISAKRGFRIVDSNRGSSHAEGYFKKPDSPEIKALMTALEDVTGEERQPYTMGGGTYARGLENTVAFGAAQNKYSGILGEGRGSAHDADEYLTETEIFQGIEVFAKAVENLSRI